MVRGMTIHFPAFAFALLAIAAPAPVAAAQRSFTITSFEKVRLDGPYSVRLTTGVAPFARATGSAAAIDGISVEVQGQTLIIRPSVSNWGGYPGEGPGPVQIAIGTHDLTTVWLNGAGALAIDGVKGQSFDMTLQGPGSIAVGRLSVDRLKAGMSGSGSAVLGGKAAQVSAILRGPATLDGSGLMAKDAVIGAEGSAVLKMSVSGTAKVDAAGTASVELGGGPACTVRAIGSSVVSGCR